MPLTVPKSILDAAGLDLASAVPAYADALAAHALTVNEPAPAVHPLIEAIVREHGGEYETVDDTPVEAVVQARQRLIQGVYSELGGRIDALASPGRRQLAQIDLATLGTKRDRSSAENARLSEVQALFQKIGALSRHAALLHIEIGDLPEGDLTTWQSHGWPA